MSAARLSQGLLERAFSPPRRPAPLAALAVELRMSGAWVELCRLAAERRPDWLEDRLLAADLLIAAIGAVGDPEPDETIARAVCEMALAICGRREEALALSRAAAAFNEPPASDFSGLELATQPRLADLVADLRSPRVDGSVASAATVVDVAGRGAAPGAAVVEALPGRAAGLRLDSAMRLFSPSDPDLARAVDAAAARFGQAATGLLVRVEDEAGEPAGGDACGAAILLAAEAAKRGRSIDERTIVVGALSGRDGCLRTPRTPAWEDARAVLERAQPDTAVLASDSVPGQRARQVDTLSALRRAIGRPQRRRRALIAAALAVAIAGVVAALIVPSLGTDAEADRTARRAEDLLASSPARSAMLAARALAQREDGQTLEAALRVMAAAPLTEATGQEAGHLIAVAIDGDRTVTTVSTTARATRWALRKGNLRPRSAVELPREATLVAMSPGGRWLLLQTPITYNEVLLVDTTGRRATRLLRSSEVDTFAVSDGERPVVALGGGDRLALVGGGTPPPVEGTITSLAFSPSGRLLAIGNEAGSSAVFVRSREGWRLFRPWREEASIAEVEEIEVDDAGTTVANLESNVGPGVRWQSRHDSNDAHSIERDGSLAGRSLIFEPLEHELKLTDQRPSSPDQAIAIRFPVDGATERPLAVSPDGDHAVLAAPDGLFSILDLRRVRPILGDGVVADSVHVDGNRLSALEVDARGSRLVAWDLRDLSPPRYGRRVPGQPRLALRAAEGSLLIHSSGGDAILVRSGADGAVIGRLRSRGGESWSSVAADRAGDVVAAVDERDGMVTLWRLRHESGGRVSGHVVFRSRDLSEGTLDFPPPLAISPDGDRLAYGTPTRLFQRDLDTGTERRLPLADAGGVIRLRFHPRTGERLLVSTSRGVVELRGSELQSRRQLISTRTHDAVFVPAGAVAAATGFGVRLYTRSGDPIEFDDAATGDGIGPGTISASADNAVLVPHTGRLPLVVLRTDRPTPAALCALAGARALATDGSCGPSPDLPDPEAPLGAAGDRGGGTTLSANGLGWLRLGERLPGGVARLPAYSYDECAARTLPGRGAAVVTRKGRIESIVLFRSAYAEESARYRADVEVATNLGLTPSAASSAPEVYGSPDERAGGHMSWLLPRAGGGHSVLSIDDDYESELSLTLSLEEAQCESWE